MKNCIIILSTILFATSCSKIENKDRTAKGKIVDSVSVPIANKEFALIISSTRTTIGAGNGYTEEKLYKFNTDASGNFSVVFQAKKTDVVQITLPKATIDNTIYWSRGASKDLEINVGTVPMPRR